MAPGRKLKKIIQVATRNLVLIIVLAFVIAVFSIACTTYQASSSSEGKTVNFLGIPYNFTVPGSSSESKTVAGKFWGMPYNFAVDQKTIPWFKEPTLLDWLSLIFSLPAAFVALWSLRKVEKDLAKVANSISNVFSVTDIRGHNIKVTQGAKQHDPDEADTNSRILEPRTKEIIKGDLTTAQKTIEKDFAAIEELEKTTRTYMDQVQQTSKGLHDQYAAMDQVRYIIIAPLFKEFEDRYAGIARELEMLHIDMNRLYQVLPDTMNAIESSDHHLTAIKKLEETTRTYMDQVQQTIKGLHDQYAAMDEVQNTINGPSFEKLKRYARIISELERLRNDMSLIDQDLTHAISSYKEIKEKKWYQFLSRD